MIHILSIDFQPFVLAPNDFANIKANVKVASTENGIIFGNIVYDIAGSTSDRNVVVLNDIHIDIMDYIVPASCTETEFRSMWAEFEWENKVSVNTSLTDLMGYLNSLLASTNMKCLTPDKALQGECGFMAANLYAKSIFGEDALANVSLEKNFNKPEAPVTGHIRWEQNLHHYTVGYIFSFPEFERSLREWLSVLEIRSIFARRPDRKKW